MVDKKTVFHVIPNLTIGGAQTFLKVLIDGITEWQHRILILENCVTSDWIQYPIEVISITQLMRLCKCSTLEASPFHFHWFPPFTFIVPNSKRAKTIVTIQENHECSILNAGIYAVSTLSGLRFTPLRSKGIIIAPAIDPRNWKNKLLNRKKGLLIRHSTLYPHKLSEHIMREICSYDLQKYHWRIIGVGDPCYQSYLKDKYIMSNRICLGGSIDICAELNTAWLYVYHTSANGEHYGLCFQEALASGIPIITDDQTGATEQIENGKTGFICSNHRTMKSKVDELYNNYASYSNLLETTKNQQQHFQKRYYDFLDAYANLYSS